ncbi:MAG: universal stress protein [Acidimicrobiales bacterium]
MTDHEHIGTDQRDLTPRTIVLGLDGSPTSFYATRWVAALAAGIGARVVLINAASPFDGLVHDSIRFDPGNWRQTRRRHLHDEWAEPLRELGVDHTSRLVEKSAGTALLMVAAEEDADLIVVGIHQHRTISGTLSAHLACHASCPVLAIPLPARGSHVPEANLR